MLPVTGNILDQLLGGLDTAQVPTLGNPQQAGGVADGLPFGSLLSMLVNGQGVPVETSSDPAAIAQPAPMPQVTVPFEQFLTGAAAPETTVEPSVPVLNDDLAALVSNDKAGWLDGQSTTEKELPSMTLPQRATTMVEPTFIANQNVRDLVHSKPAELQSAIYRVLDAGIKGDALELKVVTDAKNAEPVKITLPAEMLTSKDATSALTAERGSKSTNTRVSSVPRVALNDVAAPAAQNLDDLLAKMNLKAVEVKIEPAVSAGQPQKQQATLQMFGVVDGNQVVIKSKLDKQQIDVRTDARSNRVVAPKASTTQPEVDAKGSAVESARTEVRPIERSTAVSVEAVRRQMPFNLTEKLTANENFIPFETGGQQTDGLSAKGDMIPRFDSATPAPIAKMTLPQNLDKALRPGGQSVVIKIEPEQLGPARLHLSMQNNLLTARVTVDSVLAKTAVEFSLDQLTDQLSRAGIEVDRIEVSLSDRESREQFFHRRPNWAQPHNQSAGPTDEPFELEQVTPSQTLYTPPEEFVRADGVNLLV